VPKVEKLTDNKAHQKEKHGALFLPPLNPKETVSKDGERRDLAY
jgi:hypothetical protein